jgi:hypothetical protein
MSERHPGGAIDGCLNVTLGEQSMDLHPGGAIDGFFSIRKQAGLNVTLGEQSMDSFEGFLVTLILVGTILQFAARPTDRTEH